MALTYPRRSLSSTAREALYDRCRGDNEFPICNICHLPVDGVRQAWHESHDPEGLPHALGGTETGIAHRECNLRHGAEVVTPLVAKVARVRRNHIGASVSQFPMPGGRNSRLKKLVGGGVVVRQPRVPKVSFDDLDAQLAAIAGAMSETSSPSRPAQREAMSPSGVHDGGQS